MSIATDNMPTTMTTTSPSRVLLIEDDKRLADMVSEYLGQNGYVCTHADHGVEGLNKLAAHSFDLVVLDLMLPDLDGLEICRRIRSMAGEQRKTPVLMLTAKGDPMDRVIGLEMGADDYMPKPFEPRELLARIKAILRRGSMPLEQGEGVLRFGSLEINREARTVTVADELRDITSHQFDILVVLAERAGRVLSRDQVMELVRGRELEAFDRSIDVHIGRIRLAIEEDVRNPKRILTVRGVGYVFAKQQN